MRRSQLLLLIPPTLGALACNGGEQDPPLDADGDHWVYWVDCDERDPDTHPFADETCDGADNDCDGQVDEEGAVDAPTWYYDADLDGFGDPATALSLCLPPAGYVANGDDCNDSSAEIKPGATELCDDIDNDCDGDVDEPGAVGPGTYYRDDDGDGFGDPGYREEACAPSDGFVDDNSDCDDTRADVNPAAPEVCDPFDVDEDCDGTADDLDADATGLTTWYADADGDTYGDPALGLTTAACEQPQGFADDPDDCDDGRRTVNPESRELCGNGLDDDCDGLTDGDDDGAAPVPWYTDLDGDGYGDSAAPLGVICDDPGDAATVGGDCDDADPSVNPAAGEVWYDGVDADCDGASDYDADADGHDASGLGGGDCDDGEPSVNPDAIEICGDGLDNDCDGGVDACGVAVRITGATAGDLAGGAVAGGHDVTGDGLDDLLIGADREDAGGAGAGAVYVVSGLISADTDLGSLGGPKLVGEALGDHAGISVASPGDVDGDGFADILLGAYDADAGGVAAGVAYLVSGPVSGVLPLADAQARMIGEQAGDLAGFTVAAPGDFDGDGRMDVLVSAYQEDTGGAQAGAVYLFEGPVSGNLRLWTADLKVTGESAGDQAGWSISPAGDTDGDGLADALIGVPYEHASGVYRGAAYVVAGGRSGTFGLDEADAKRTGITAGDQAGFAVGGGADVDGDGYADILVGAPEEDAGGSGAGAAYLVMGPLSGASSLRTAHTTFVGENNDDMAGSDVAFVGDLDGDGRSDIAIGARLDDVAGSDAGAVYLVLDPGAGTVDLADASAKLLGENSGDWVGSAVSAAGDLDGDGAADLVVGVPYDDSHAADAGAVWVLLGGGF